MNKFIVADQKISISAPFVVLALIVVGGCVSLHERNFGRDIELPALDRAATDEGRVRLQCPLRYVYACERHARTQPGNCYCTPEPASLPRGPAGPQRVF